MDLRSRTADSGSARESADARFERMHKELRQRICRLRYSPGTILNENDLAAEFGVSRTPMRRVLQRLNFDGLVETRNGIGTVVTDPDLKTYREIYALRMKLAEMIGELSPIEAPASKVPMFEDLLRRCAALPKTANLRALSDVHYGVQNAFLDVIGNAPLREMSEWLYFRTARIWQVVLPGLDWPTEVDFARSEIEEILRALRLGDIRAVGLVRRNYIAMALARMSQSLGS